MNYTEFREKLIEINNKVRDNFDYKFTEDELDFFYTELNIEDPQTYGFADDETYIAMYLDGMTKAIKLKQDGTKR